MSQRTTPNDAAKKTPSSSCAKHLEFARLKETGKEWCFPRNVEKKRVSRPVASLPRVKHCEKSLSKNFQEAKVYRCFIGKEDTEDRSSKLTFSGTSKQKSLAENTITKTCKRRIKTEDTTLATPRKHHDVAVRRYALYRGMLNQSRFQEDHEKRKDIGFKDKVFHNKKKENEATTYTEIPKFQISKLGRSSPRGANSVGSTPETVNATPRNDDLIGTQFPKRIYIREISNGAIVDEIVDIKNEREWEVLNYMAPLRHISCKPNQTFSGLRFRDLRNFDVYYYPYPWR